MLHFADPPRRRRPSLTPMIDVVFLLLVFFMLVARFGPETALELRAGGGTAPYSGPPRLVEVAAGGVTLNGRPLALEALGAALAPLMDSPDDAILVLPDAGAQLGHLAEVLSALRAAGLTGPVLVTQEGE